MGPDFKADRDRIQDLFTTRAKSHGAIGVDMYAQIRAATDQALDHLKQYIREVPTRDYNQSRNFLDSVAYEASFAAG